jgi:hypothetical protein
MIVAFPLDVRRIHAPLRAVCGAKNMNATRCRSLPWCQLLLALGAIFLSASAPAQDACSLQCSNKEAAWCDGTEFVCPFSYQTCMEIVAPMAAGTVRWVWEIRKDGTYNFHAEGPGAAPAHSGTFAASNGHYVLNSRRLSFWRKKWRARRDSNPRPPGSKPGTLSN